LDEFFEVLTWAQLEVHKKPIVVINVKKYWDPLFSLIDHTISSGFAENSLKKLFTITDTATEAVDYLIKQNQRSEFDS
jgi:predicted Rossmann-fold nucleotide-binding protein